MIVKEQFPKLFHKTSTGATQEWEISVVEVDGVANIRTIYGQRDGQKQTVLSPVTEGKNVGKKNATTPLRQAVLESKAQWKKKLDKGYVESLVDIDSSPKLPMLAHPYEDRKHKIVFAPCAYAQPKLNGIRCFATKVAEDKVVYTSRNGKYFKSMERCTPWYLKMLMIGETSDGEIYNPRLTFQQITHYARHPAEIAEADGTCLYHYAYDFATFAGGFKDRYEELSKRFEVVRGIPKPVQLVMTREVTSHEDFLKVHRSFTASGFEGSILRNATGEYKFDHRSTDLLKHKDFIDAEYEIVDVLEVRLGGKDGACVWVCQCPRTGQEFHVTPEGSWDDKNAQLLNKDNIVGKLGTVRYQNLSDGGIPIFPVGTGIRDYE